MFAKDILEEFKMECELRKLSGRTIESYYNNTALFLNYIENEFETYDIEEITHQHIKPYMRQLIKKKLSESYANSILKSLRAFFEYCAQEDYIRENFSKRVNWQRERKVLINTFTDDEVKSLLNAFNFSDYIQARNRTIIAVAFDTSARNSEICNIKIDNIENDTILIYGKGNKERRVPISPVLRRSMNKYERLKKYYFSDKNLSIDYYFLSRTGKRLTPETLERIFNEANKKANVRETIRCSPHTSRHYFAQAQLRNGLDIFALARVLGYENINTTKRYLQSMHDDKIMRCLLRQVR